MTKDAKLNNRVIEPNYSLTEEIQEVDEPKSTDVSVKSKNIVN